MATMSVTLHYYQEDQLASHPTKPFCFFMRINLDYATNVGGSKRAD